MADILTWRLRFIANNPYGTFVTGDLLEFYYDNEAAVPSGGGLLTDSVGIRVFKNGVEIFTGPTIPKAINGDRHLYIEPEKVSQINCNGTTQVWSWVLGMEFPYGSNIYYPNNPSCAINAPPCDLQMIGVPVVTPATGEAVADGQITVTAASSRPIQYRLGSDFVYGDGTAQSTGVFINLLPGEYIVFSRDEFNCNTNVRVTVPFTEAYGPYNRLEFTVLNQGVTRVDISKFAYAGAVTEVTGADVTLERSLRGEGGENKFESILATSVNVGLTSTTDFQFQSLYTNNPNEFRIYVYKDSVLKGIYKVLPQQYEEDYKKQPYYVKVRGTDGLPSLKDFQFIQDDGEPFHASIRIIELVAFILKKTGLNLNIRVAVNMYATGMDTTDADDPFDQAYVDMDAYYMDNNNPTCDYVLRQILETFGARILQENAVWNVVRIEEMHGEYDYREFDSNGTYVSNGSYNPIVEINPPDSVTGVCLSDTDHYMKLCPGYGKVRVFYKLGLRDNILENGNFRLKSNLINGVAYGQELDTFGWQLVEAGYPLASSYDYIDGGTNVAWKISGNSTITVNTGNAYYQSNTYSLRMGLANTLRLKIRYKVPAPVAFALTPIPINIPYQKVRIRVKYGSKYLQSTGTWTTTENFISIYVNEYDKFLETELTAVPPDSTSSPYDFDIRVYHSYIYHSEYWSFADLRARVTYSAGSAVLPTGTRTEVQLSTSALTDANLHYYELEENTDPENEPLIIRPTDYNAVNNPRQWVRKVRLVKTILTSFTSPFWLDKVTCEFLTSGESSPDTIIREVIGESKNPLVLEKEVTHGSYQSLITTIPSFGININTGNGSFNLTTTSVLSADVLYAGYLSDSNGDGYVNWTRDGVPESTTLHAILLQQYVAQYKRSWRKLTGTLYNKNGYFSFLDVYKMTSDGNRLYMPISGTIDDKNNRLRSAELLELMDITAAGSGTSAFTRGFKQSGFR